MSERELDLLKIAVSASVDRQIFKGAQRHQLRFVEDYLGNRLVAELNAYVLTEHAGPAVEDRVAALLPIRPRWLPRWLWRRIPTRRVEWTLTVEPRWSYPNAAVQLPAVGRPHKLAYRLPAAELSGVGWSDD